MTPEQLTQLLTDVAVTKDNVEDIKDSMVTHDQCEATRERARRCTSNGVLTTYRDRAWRLVTIVLAIAGTGLVSWLVNR
jgi:hypothetical protein